MGWTFSREWRSLEALTTYLGKIRSDVVVLSEPAVTHEGDYRVRWQAISHAGKSYVTCDLLSADDKGNWGYKDLVDAEGPLYFSCPLSVLNAADAYPSSCESATHWRNQCRATQQLQVQTKSSKARAALR